VSTEITRRAIAAAYYYLTASEVHLGTVLGIALIGSSVVSNLTGMNIVVVAALGWVAVAVEVRNFLERKNLYSSFFGKPVQMNRRCRISRRCVVAALVVFLLM